MRLSTPTRRAISEVICFVLAVSILGTVPRAAQAETEQECIARVTATYNADVAICAASFGPKPALCAATRDAEYTAAFNEEAAVLPLITARYNTHYDLCLSDYSERKADCKALHDYSYAIASLVLSAKLILCNLSPYPTLCIMYAYYSYSYSLTQYDAAEFSCVFNASGQREQCIKDAEDRRDYDAGMAAQTRATRELVAEAAYILCLASAAYDFAYCVGAALSKSNNGFMACSAGGGG